MYLKKCLRQRIQWTIFVLIITVLYIFKKSFKSTIQKSIISITFDILPITSKLDINTTQKKEKYTEETFYKKRSHIINKYTYEFIITPTKPCSSDSDLVILVHSQHSSVDVRQSIRQTWGSISLNNDQPSIWPQKALLKINYSLYFIFGTQKDPGLEDLLLEENNLHGDIVQGNFIDSYTNMTLKSLLGFKFLLKFCSSTKHMIKSDSDMFLNLPHITNYLSQNQLTRSILGPICIGSKVYRTGKWGISKEEFPFETYPVYEAGSAYIISADLYNDIFTTSDYVPYIYIDDVYITGIIGRILNVTHIKEPGFAYWTTRGYKICDIQQNKVFTITNLKHKEIRDIWNALKDAKCPTTSSTL